MRRMKTRTIIAIAGTVAATAICVLAGWAAGSSGIRWEAQKTGTKASLRGLSVVSENVVWASGSGGTYLRTRDAGRTWAVGKVSGAEELDFRGIKAFDATTALLMSSGPAEQGRARIFRTSDGGAQWSLVYETKTPGAFLDCMAFWDRQHGIVIGDPVGGSFFVIVTDDGGRTWEEVARPQVGPNTGAAPDRSGISNPHPVAPTSGATRVGYPTALANEGAFAASNSCVAVEGKSNAWFVTGGAGVARVFRSSDSGRTWQVETTPVKADTASAGLFSVAFRDAQHGVAVAGDYRQPTASETTVAVTEDGGRTWKLARAPVAGLFLSGVTWSRARHVMAVGPAGWAESNDGGQSWTKGGDEGFNVIAFGAGRRWAAGSGGRVALSSGSPGD